MRHKSEYLNELKNKFDKMTEDGIEKKISSIDKAIKNPETNKYNKQRLIDFLAHLQTQLNSKDFEKIGKIFLEESLKIGEQIRYCAYILCESQFSFNMEKFFSIIKTDDQLKSFLSDPYLYIYNNPNRHSMYDLQILQNLSNSPDFYTFLGKSKPAKMCLTKLSYKMYELEIWDYTNNRPNYGCTDAVRFHESINPEVKDLVLKQAKREYHGPKKVHGYGAQASYTYEAIKQTAEMVKAEKRAVCQTFSQFGAAKLLEAIQNGEFPGMHVKIVSHQAALGSHTFLLVEHNTEDLDDLSNCIIIDPWAVSMGFYESCGVFTMKDYPFPGMTDKLICCFDNKNPNLSISNATSANMMGELKTRVGTVGMFSEANAPKLSTNQQSFIKFIGNLKKHVSTSVHKEVLDLLINEVTETKRGNKEFYYNITKQAILVLHAQILEKKMDGNYKIARGKKAGEEVLKDFPEKVVGVINDLLGEDKDTELTLDNLTKVAQKIHEEEKDLLNFSNKRDFNLT